MMTKQLRWFGILAFVFLSFAVACCVVLWRLSDHDLDQRASEPFDFKANGAQVKGTLWLPDQPPLTAIVIVPGETAGRTSAGGYAPFINTLLDAGVAVASWDKPGIGVSEGDWLSQSMDDRANETRAALAALSGRMEGLSVGALGFSQAGWVLPRISAQDTAFLVLAGPAISWRSQGAFNTRTRLKRSGMGDADVEQAVEQKRLEDERLFGAGAHYDPALLPAEITRHVGPSFAGTSAKMGEPVSVT